MGKERDFHLGKRRSRNWFLVSGVKNVQETKKEKLVLLEKAKEQIILLFSVLVGLLGGITASLLGSSLFEAVISFGVSSLWAYILMGARARVFEWRCGYPMRGTPDKGTLNMQ